MQLDLIRSPLTMVYLSLGHVIVFFMDNKGFFGWGGEGFFCLVWWLGFFSGATSLVGFVVGFPEELQTA